MSFREEFGKLVREQRQANGLQLRDLAEKAHLSYSYLSELERGVKECSSTTMECLADGLGVELHDLIIETGYRMAGDSKATIPDSPAELFIRNDNWTRQYADLVG